MNKVIPQCFRKLTPEQRQSLKLACQRFGINNPERVAQEHNAKPGPYTTASVVLGYWYRMH